ncbi:serine hydrolase domain-containing protein [Parapedobacter koreensis]|uniref:CubicO group peptidase, beta-lactamase class C family n=1 Tax=Parapedobacter koreensis TaxID=332977 RepID=A0A1H7F3C9_9SPHI|nr:serine hydrolase domain-containing protein [Parapedobacter koreensis]SEK17625.1 CubicO group peptidase, beta-lactamase class C family [Parapedobacter koreensis]
MMIRKITCAALLMLVGFMGVGQPVIDTAAVHAYFSMQQEQIGFNGVVRITRRDRVLYEMAYGLASHELGTPMKTTDVFRIASISKPFTAILTLLACKEGLLREDDSIGRFYPQFTDPVWQGITIRQLLTHQSGIPHNEGIADYWREKAFLPLDRERCLSELFAMELLFAPGENSHYSSPGYFLLADILEQVYNQSYAALVSEKITAPLSMGSTGVYDGRTIVPGMVTGYHQIGNRLIAAPYRDPSLMKGSGNLYTSAADLADWLFSLGNGRWPEDVVSKLFEVESTVPMANADRYGYGFYYRQGADHQKAAWYHGGGTFGCSAIAVWYPEDQASIVVLSNVSVLPVNRLWVDLEGILSGFVPDMPRQYSNIQLTDSALNRLAGTYAAQGAELSVIAHQGQLYAKLGANPPFELKATGTMTFFGPKAGVRITFRTGPLGNITGLIAERDGKPLTFERK